MNKYHKNLILCGDIDFFCLLCDESFEATSDVERHIRWENHRKSIKKQSYIPKYKKDYIYKIGSNCYCEVCNYVMKPQSLSGHIKEEAHKEHKMNPEKPATLSTVLVKRNGTTSISFPKLTINKLQWHGIANSKCTLCHINVTVIDDHVKSTIHMVNVIQSKVIVNSGNYYRQVRDEYHCFICSDILNEQLLSDHSCKIDVAAKNALQTDTIKSKLNTEIGLVPSANEIQKFFEINLDNKTAKCLTCKFLVSLKFKTMFDHKMSHRFDGESKLTLQDHGKLRSELAKYGKQNHIKLNEGGSKGYCLLCDIYISAHMSVAMEHVNGARHKGHLELKGLIPEQKHSQPKCKMESLKKYMKHVFHSESFNVFCVNYAFAVEALSFMFITPVENNPKQPKKKCFQCEMLLPNDTCVEVTEHWKNKEHKEAFMETSVLLLEDEFIRMVHPNLFHCGFCNQVYSFWETMEKHILTFGHKYAKKLNANLYELALKSFEIEKAHLHYQLLTGLV